MPEKYKLLVLNSKRFDIDKKQDVYTEFEVNKEQLNILTTLGNIEQHCPSFGDTVIIINDNKYLVRAVWELGEDSSLKNHKDDSNKE